MQLTQHRVMNDDVSPPETTQEFFEPPDRGGKYLQFPVIISSGICAPNLAVSQNGVPVEPLHIVLGSVFEAEKEDMNDGNMGKQATVPPRIIALLLPVGDWYFDEHGEGLPLTLQELVRKVVSPHVGRPEGKAIIGGQKRLNFSEPQLHGKNTHCSGLFVIRP